MTDELDSLSDAELNELFAAEVAGYELGRHGMTMCRVKEKRANGDVLAVDIEPFSTDANAVLPWLEKTFKAFQWNPDDRCLSWINRGPHKIWDQCAFGSIPLENGAFARAACLALIRAKRAK